MRKDRISNVMGVDDAPFPRGHRGDVPLVGAVCTRTRLDGVLLGRARRDGDGAARSVARMLVGSIYHAHVQAVLLEGITLAGFNVVDLQELSERVERPVLVVVGKEPRLEAIERALLGRVPGGLEKWQRIVRAGPVEAIGDVYVQRCNLERSAVRGLLRRLTLHGRLPEPLRLAHLIARTHAVKAR